MKTTFFRIVFCASIIFFSSVTLLAANQETGQSVTPKPRAVEKSSEWKPHVGFLVGATMPEGSGDSSSEFGVDVGYQPYIPFGLGAEFIHSDVDVGNEKQERNTIWVKGTYNFGGTIDILKESYVGLGVGAVIKSGEAAAAVAPLIGFDIPIGDRQAGYFSLGANARYAIVSNNDIDTFSLNGIVKYWY